MRDKQSKNSGSKRFPKSGKNQLSFSNSQKTFYIKQQNLIKLFKINWMFLKTDRKIRDIPVLSIQISLKFIILHFHSPL